MPIPTQVDTDPDWRLTHTPWWRRLDMMALRLEQVATSATATVAAAAARMLVAKPSKSASVM